MIKLVSLITLLIAGAGVSIAQNNATFSPGEKLTYRLSYGYFEPGIATIELKPSVKTYYDRNTWHVVAKGNTLPMYDYFFKVRDTYETYLDAETIVPWEFIRNVDEGGYVIKQHYKFDQNKHQVSTEKNKTFEVKPGIQDMISSFYKLRMLDFKTAKIGQIFTIYIFVDGKTERIRVRYVGKENKKIDKGTFRCLKFRPVLAKKDIFEKEEDLNVWISDDDNHIPILAEVTIWVGSIKVELVGYSGLTNPVALVK